MVAAGALGLPEPEETETTFAGNALLKARAAADARGLIALADDSGLSVAALDGAPGIYSARWAGPDRDFATAMAKVEQRLAETESDDRRAWFTCALAVAWPDGPAVVVEGRVDGDADLPAARRRRASATTRSSCPRASAGPSARWTRPRRTASATAPAPSPS